MKYNILLKNGHYEVYINNDFYCSCDTFSEAIQEIENYKEN